MADAGRGGTRPAFAEVHLALDGLQRLDAAEAGLAGRLDRPAAVLDERRVDGDVAARDQQVRGVRDDLGGVLRVEGEQVEAGEVVERLEARPTIALAARTAERSPFPPEARCFAKAAPAAASTSISISRSAAKASISRTRSVSAPFSISSIRAILSSVIVVSVKVQASQLEL